MKRLVVSAGCHWSSRPPNWLLERLGISLRTISLTSEGCLDLDHLESLGLNSDTLVSVEWVNNETGYIQPVADVMDICRKHGAAVHLDGAQVPARVVIDPALMKADAITLSSHKFYGPKGVGALCLGEDFDVSPLSFGGGQESGLRSGTENVPAIVGFGLASSIMSEEQDEVVSKGVSLRQRLETGIQNAFPDVQIASPTGENATATVLAGRPGVLARDVLKTLDEADISAGSGSACSTASGESSAIFKAMGIPNETASSMVRFGLGRFNTTDEVDQTLDVLSRNWS